MDAEKEDINIFDNSLKTCAKDVYLIENIDL